MEFDRGVHRTGYIAVILLLITSLSSAGIDFKLDHVESDFGYGCQYYTIDSDFSFDSLEDAPVSSYDYAYDGAILDSQWEMLVTQSKLVTRWVPDVSCTETVDKNGSTVESCEDKGSYASAFENVQSWQPVSSKISVKEGRNQVRFCAHYDMSPLGDGTWGARIDMIPTFKGVSYAQYEWFNLSWGSCVPFNVTAETAPYPYKLKLNTSLVNYSKILPGGADIRVLEGNCSAANITQGPLPHWVQSRFDTAGDSFVWFASNKSAQTEYSLFYFNPEAVNTSACEGVFGDRKCDDFSGASINTTRWSGDTTAFQQSDGNLTFSNTTGGAWRRIYTSLNWLAIPYVVESRITGHWASGADVPFGQVYGFNGTVSGHGMTDNSANRILNIAGTPVTGSTENAGQPYIMKTIVNDTANITTFQNDTFKRSFTSATNADGSSAGMAAFAHPAYSGTGKADWIIMYPYDTSLPAFTYGAEESGPFTLIVTQHGPANNTVFSTGQVTFNWSCNGSASSYLANITVNDAVVATPATVNATPTTTTLDFLSGAYNWSVSCGNQTVHVQNNSQALYFNVSPVIQGFIDSPANNSTILGSSGTFYIRCVGTFAGFDFNLTDGITIFDDGQAANDSNTTASVHGQSSGSLELFVQCGNGSNTNDSQLYAYRFFAEGTSNITIAPINYTDFVAHVEGFYEDYGSLVLAILSFGFPWLLTRRIPVTLISGGIGMTVIFFLSGVPGFLAAALICILAGFAYKHVVG
jgi:hypothetical protein